MHDPADHECMPELNLTACQDCLHCMLAEEQCRAVTLGPGVFDPITATRGPVRYRECKTVNLTGSCLRFYPLPKEPANVQG